MTTCTPTLPDRPRAAPDVHSSSAAYARRFAGAVGDYFLETQRRHVLELLQPWPACRVLDVGGGHAQLAVPLVQAGFQVTVAGSDVKCRRRLDSLLPPASFAFQACDLVRLPFPARAFDVVLGFRLLPHLEHWREAAAEMCRVARHAVIVDYADTCSFNAVSPRLFFLKRMVEPHLRPYRRFSRREVLSAVKEHGFGDPVARPQFLLPMALHRAARCAPLSRVLESAARRIGLTRRFGSPVILRVCRL